MGCICLGAQTDSADVIRPITGPDFIIEIKTSQFGAQPTSPREGGKRKDRANGTLL